jgi:hypothetical protein
METCNCQNCQQDFTIDFDDVAFYNKVKVPSPTFCPQCRMLRRFNFRNERFLFRRPDARTGGEVFSGFSPSTTVTTYENHDWFGDSWDPFVTGREYDFSRPFFEQYKELLSVAPVPARSVFNIVNSPYCNEASELKNSYLAFNTDYAEDSGYVRKARYIKNSFDLYESAECELCYEGVLIEKSYNVFYSMECENCVDV